LERKIRLQKESIEKKKLSILNDRLRYDGNLFSLISSNFWGAEIYPILGMKYLMPFVGLYIDVR
jgi:uncharacterized protein (DUF1919 family)